MVQRKCLGRKLSANIKIQNLPVYFSSTRFKVDNQLCFGTKQQIMELIFTRNNIRFQFQLYFKVIRPINGDSSIWGGGGKVSVSQKRQDGGCHTAVKTLYCNRDVTIWPLCSPSPAAQNAGDSYNELGYQSYLKSQRRNVSRYQLFFNIKGVVFKKKKMTF